MLVCLFSVMQKTRSRKCVAGAAYVMLVRSDTEKRKLGGKDWRVDGDDHFHQVLLACSLKCACSL